MHPRRDQFPGLRKPTEAERQHIARHWLPILRSQWTPKAGRIPCFLGRMFLCAGAVLAMRIQSSMLEMVAFFLFGGIFLLFSGIFRKGSRKIKALVDALEAGNYSVSDVYAVKFDGTFYGNSPSAIATLMLPNGEPIQGFFRVPPECAQPYSVKYETPVPALLIMVDPKNELLAILCVNAHEFLSHSLTKN